MSKKSRKDRARKREKVAAVAAKTPRGSTEVIKEESAKKARVHALNYLVRWSKQEEWKFNKTRQVWLLKNMYGLERVPAKYFKLLLKYSASI